MTDVTNLTTAFVYDRVNKWGGAEQVLLELHKLFPHAPLYTSVFSPSKANWAKVFPKVVPSFLQYLPFAKDNHELFPWLTPLGFETFAFNDYELVISVTSADAKGIITSPNTFHVCYCLTPTRYLWIKPPKLNFVTKPIIHYLKSWDRIASRRPDSYVAISQTVQSRIKSIYGLDSEIVYPPVDLAKYQQINTNSLNTKKYFLFVGRLVYHKEPEKLIQLFNQLNLPLVVVGTGRLLPALQSQARSNIRFVGQVDEVSLITIYNNAKALVSLHEEDFGLTYVEAQASGLPIIGLNRGGVSEVVRHNLTGFLVDTIEELKSVIQNFDSLSFKLPATHLESFSQESFRKQFVKVLNNQWMTFKNTYTS